MTQRLTPGGQGPARRAGQRGRGAPPRSGRPVQRGAEPRDAGDSGRSANRPAARRAPVRRTTAPQPRRFTGRATVLLVVLIALALGYTYPIRVYLSQQSDITQMEADQEAQRRRIDDLTQQAALWQDHEYIKIQARKRFFMVYPGEVPLVVLTDPEGAARDAGTAPDAGRTAPADPWYDTLWSSIQAANSTGQQR